MQKWFDVLKVRLAAAFAASIIGLSSIGPVSVNVARVVPVVAASAVVVASFAPTQSAQAAAMTDNWENSLSDFLFRGQAYTPPATLYVGLLTGACSDSAGGTEVSGGSYARVAVTSSLANWAGTQSAGSTAVSSGTGGTTSNNGAITFPAPTANWGTVSHFGIYTASTAGTLLVCAALTNSKTVNNGDAAPSFAAAALTFQIDN